MAEIKKPRLTEIRNRRVEFEFKLLNTFEAGLILTGTEVKSLREGHANLNDAYCYIRQGELFVRNMFISEYDLGTYNNHDPRRPRKLLLTRNELNKLGKKVKEKGFTIVPVRLYFSERGLAKLEIALAQGKKSFDKRHSIKEKDTKRDLDRLKRYK
ncbi:MAG TPA: SsrA-binding protein SmpB [Saprospiraceae bacterium]|nr:SsrA-binding protein SmpB [Saprospiraceae bacterium]MCC6687670.1 SsrA-binding protein SmpB [Saprospiraceae bacterium]HMV23409.1 SsrA-binding protein SmpB [Saprospiraceae bacterium]HMX83301.1 SsrA-binding protein SmpB [Saprospiraceae bacterium]HMX85753.1 SsrA-binding protein SmpB [Saprospiraceae bacterium]